MLLAATAPLELIDCNNGGFFWGITYDNDDVAYLRRFALGAEQVSTDLGNLGHAVRG